MLPRTTSASRCRHMETLHALLGLIRDPGHLIALGGYPGMALIVFLATGALVFFLPGDSLLVMAGLYAAQGSLDLALLNLILIPCAIAGDATSYWFGARTGPRLFSRPESRFFKPQHLLAARDFYETHGGKAIIIARFMPLVRTFVPVVAGVARMSYRRFASFNAIGAVAWVLSMTVTGFALGQVPGVVQHIEKIIIAVVLLSIAPGVVAWLRARLAAKPTPADHDAASGGPSGRA